MPNKSTVEQLRDPNYVPDIPGSKSWLKKIIKGKSASSRPDEVEQAEVDGSDDTNIDGETGGPHFPFDGAPLFNSHLDPKLLSIPAAGWIMKGLLNGATEYATGLAT